jgi:SagB-type dehydrogenase family enzyme
MSNQETTLAWKYHDLTKHSYSSIRTNPHFLDWQNQPSPFKVYLDLEPIPLPRDLLQSNMPTLEAIASPEVVPLGEMRPSLDQLATMLYFSAGVTRKKTYPGGEIYFRAAACAGARYPIELYVVCGDLDGLPPGVYHFSPGEFALRCLRSGDYRNLVIRATGDEPGIAASPVVLVSTAVSWRSTWKYRDRAYRYHFWDDGMILANALAMAAAHKLPAKLVMGFVEAEINQLLGIDGQQELALSLLALGHTQEMPGRLSASAGLPDLQLEVLPLSAAQADYPSIREMHAASSFTQASEVAEWQRATIKRHLPEATGKCFPLSVPAQEALAMDAIEQVIQQRASTRRFARKAISFTDLSLILDRATRPIVNDFIEPSTLQCNDLYLIVNWVTDLTPGAYVFRKEEGVLELLKEGDFRNEARYLTLEQDLGGDASVTLFFMADLHAVLDKLGNRGYRAAQLEAAIIGGKMYLAAYARKRGATGLTFYDDDVTEFFAPHASGKSCIFVTSIGIPGKRPLY